MKIYVVSLMSTQHVVDLMELVCKEITIDVDYAAQDAMKQMNKVLTSVYDIKNINASVFMTGTGYKVQMKSEKLKERPEGISFFRFDYNLDPSVIDSRIQ